MADRSTLGLDEPRRLALVIRVGLLALSIALTIALEPSRAHVWVALVLLVAVAALGSVKLPRRVPALVQPVLEAVLAAAILIWMRSGALPLLPYLVAPALSGGILAGVVTGAAAGLLPGALLLFTATFAPDTRYLTTVSERKSFVWELGQWTMVCLVVGLLGAWVRRLREATAPKDNAAYVAAYRLLSQLRVVSRQLAGGLDPVSISTVLLQSLATTLPFSKAAVFTRSEGGRLIPLAVIGGERMDWDTTMEEGSLLFDAWTSQVAMQRPGGLRPGTTSPAAVVPLIVGERTFGVVAAESLDVSFPPAELAHAVDVVNEAALRLETALLFQDVRAIATAEERRRLAREIHDGVAQELASFGYTVDDLAARAGEPLKADLKGLRAELTRVITELRLSIFDLRSDIGPTVGLGAALSDYVRQVGTGSQMTVHLELDESAERLRTEVETELLRIAQEAITNARKHAQARNLWVSLVVDPPEAVLTVRDDGRGLGSGRMDSFGLSIMRERAARVGARLTVENHDGGGTAVRVAVGGADRVSPSSGSARRSAPAAPADPAVGASAGGPPQD